MSGAISIKSVLWVHHRNRRIRNRTSDEEVIKKRRLKIKVKMKENKRRKKNDDDDDDESTIGEEIKVLLKRQIYTLILQVSLHLSLTVFLVI